MPSKYIIPLPTNLLPVDVALLCALDRYDILNDVLGARAVGRSSFVIHKRRCLLHRGGFLRMRGSGVFELARLGRETLFKLGYSLRPALKRSHALDPTLQNIHQLATNAFLIAAHQLPAHYPVQIQDWRNDRELRRHAAVIATEKKTAFHVSPDAWIDFRLTTSRGLVWAPIAFELDRGTESKGAWQDKIAGLLAWKDGSYQNEFKIVRKDGSIQYPPLSFAIFVDPTGKPRQPDEPPTQIDPAYRLEMLREYTRTILTDLNRQNEQHLFTFSGGAIQEFTGEDLFIKPIWSHPFDDNLYPLLEL